MIEIATIVSIVFKGMLIGIIASAPMGPVGVLCLQRTINKGRWYGFVTGCGAALSDLFYALITGYGMSFVFNYVSNNIFYLQLFGSILLLFFGYYTFRSNPVKALRAPSGKKGSYMHNFLTAFLVTLSNPLIILLFIGKTSDARLQSLIDEYRERLKHYVPFELVVIPDIKNRDSNIPVNKRILFIYFTGLS